VTRERRGSVRCIATIQAAAGVYNAKKALGSGKNYEKYIPKKIGNELGRVSMFRSTGELTTDERRTSLSGKLGLGGAILLFAVWAYGLMLLALTMLPETRGRSLGAIQPGDISSLRPSPAGNQDRFA